MDKGTDLYFHFYHPKFEFFNLKFRVDLGFFIEVVCKYAVYLIRRINQMVGLEVYILNTNVFFGDGLMVKQDFFLLFLVLSRLIAMY